jgi:hypothetical protein
MNEKSFVTALAIVPPEAAWAQIDAIRAKHDKAYGRWMPHIKCVKHMRV